MQLARIEFAPKVKKNQISISFERHASFLAYRIFTISLLALVLIQIESIN